MNRESFSWRRRDAALQSWIAARGKYQETMDRTEKLVPWSDKAVRTLAETARYRARMAEAERDYFHKLPRMIMAVCPFCQQELQRSFDPFGFEGLWWRADATPDEPRACSHFQLLCGAVAYGNVPPETTFEVQPGPDVPYVIPAILKVEFMSAVIGRVPMENGCVAYPIAYFGEKRLAPENLTAEWRRSIYSYTDSRREDRWRIPAEPWDFELERWLTTGRLRWCPPDSRNMRLNAPGDSCPYAGLPGQRRRMILFANLVSTWAPPSGDDPWPVRPETTVP
jgi:hypothetical protein